MVDVTRLSENKMTSVFYKNKIWVFSPQTRLKHLFRRGKEYELGEERPTEDGGRRYRVNCGKIYSPVQTLFHHFTYIENGQQ